MRTALAALLLALAATPALGAECDPVAVRERLRGFAPVGFGIGTGDRVAQVWVNSRNVAYWTIIDQRGLCIVSPRIEDFRWVFPQQEGQPA